jgi:hypothetical protein
MQNAELRGYAVIMYFVIAYTSLLRREGDRLEYICFFNIFSNVSLLSDSFKLDGTVEGPY